MRSVAFLSCVVLACGACAGNPGAGLRGRPVDLGLAPFDAAATTSDLGAAEDAGMPPEDTGAAHDAGLAPDTGAAPAVDLGTVGLLGPDLGMDLGAPTMTTPTHAGQLVITEIMVDPSAVTDASGEYFELYDPSATATYDLSGCTIDDNHYPATGHTIAGGLVIAPGGYVSLAVSASPGFTPTYSYAGAFALNNSGGDSVVLDCGGVVIDRVDYGTGWPPATGASLQLSAGSLDATSNDSAASWCLSTAPISASDTDLGTPAAANSACP